MVRAFLSYNLKLEYLVNNSGTSRTSTSPSTCVRLLLKVTNYSLSSKYQSKTSPPLLLRLCYKDIGMCIGYTPQSIKTIKITRVYNLGLGWRNLKP